MPCPQFDEPDLPEASSQNMTEMHILSPAPPQQPVLPQEEQNLPVQKDNPKPPSDVPEIAPDLKKPEDDTESVDSWDASTTVEVSHDEARLQGDILQPDE